MTVTRNNQDARLNRLITLVDRLESKAVSCVVRELKTRHGRIVLANLFRQPVGSRRLTDAEIAARLQARGIDPKFMPQEV